VPRQVLVRLHRWIGIALFVYVAMICLTGSFLVYRPEILRHFEPQPLIVEVGLRSLSDAELLQAAERAFPERDQGAVYRGQQPNHAAEVELLDGAAITGYLFDPYTGEALRPTLSFGYRATLAILDLHTELLGGETGRLANAALAGAFLFIALTGILAWRPRKRKRSGQAKARTGLRRLHMTIGIGVSAFVLMWAVSGISLADADLTQATIDFFEPFDETSMVERTGDQVANWLSYLHFGRFGGRYGFCERGRLCEHGFKVLWTLLALLPVFLAVSGFVLWLRGRRAKAQVKRLGTSETAVPLQDAA
jgi:uncharacterized iron-regulated membrane protein